MERVAAKFEFFPSTFCGPKMVLANSISSSSTSASVVVAVRVRPFSQREKDRNAQLIIRMPDDRITELRSEFWIQIEANSFRDPRGLDGVRQFVFDHSYWSHDGFRVLDNGYLAPMPDGIYADQRRVFDDLGRQMVQNAWAGYNCT